MSTIELNKDNFDETIENNDVVLIDFWAEWCGPCKMFGPIFEKTAEEYPDYAFAKVDTEAQQELAASFGIRSIPTLAIFREKILLFMQPGALPAAGLKDLIDQVAKLDMDEVRAKIAEEEAKQKAAEGDNGSVAEA